MAKSRTQYRCSDCEHVELRWLGKCPACDSWNTLEAVSAESDDGADQRRGRGRAWAAAREASVTPRPITEFDSRDLGRFDVEPAEFARVLGGGIVPGSLVLLGGPPGVGKSTILTTLLAQQARAGRRVVYLSAEESASQVRSRAERLDALHEDVLLLEEAALERVLPALYDEPPQLLIIDSIQTVFCEQLDSGPGSVSQIRASGGLLADFARSTGCAVFLVGHVTKEGDLAGPRVLEHLVDTVLYFEADTGGGMRMIRAFKNRFGPTGEIAVLEMTSRGLTPVRDASAMFLRGRQKGEAGSAITAVYSGSRPFLVEVQALVPKTSYATPARVVAGVDSKRIALLSAILSRVSKQLRLAECDLYVKVAGGFRVDDPAADLAFISALASSRTDKVIPGDTVLLGEVGLTGELRPVSHLGPRLSEAAAHGFGRAIVAVADPSRVEAPSGVELVVVETLLEALQAIFRTSSALSAEGGA